MSGAGSSGSRQGAERGVIAEAATLYAPALPGQAPRARPAPPTRRGVQAVILAGVGLVCVVGIVVLAVMLRGTGPIDALEQSSSVAEMSDAGSAQDAAPVIAASTPVVTKEPTPAANDHASAEELSAAREKGPAALATLAERYPEDPAVLKALVSAYTRDKANYAKSMTTVRKLLAVAPDMARDPDVKQALLLVANGPVDVAATALDIMGKEMGARGPELLYELLSASGLGKFPKERATRLFTDPQVKEIAGPGLLIANDLRAATGCDRKKLFARAAKEGDDRALAHLKPLLATKGCSWHRQTDCFACLGDRKDLRATIDAITKRVEQASASGN
ncbi:hypothetical protein [Polyangium mundeleinium]|uniref:HEAT repeat domain-containing protein n=1 Tax=Polyangium mundeleinium TaxID=2995306 RepID=A0ABT5EVW5_9BACT|nr:hypothetical protein [Polyangium mundeleinium]MDC0745958.1 hypothetical protein [Polyangium mundeleinium]